MLLASLVLTAVVALIAGVLSFQLLKQNGRILTRLDELEAALDTPGRRGGLTRSRIKRDGLEPGTPAPDFRVPRLDGGELTLAEYRGRRVLLVFSDPSCGPCVALAPKLQRQWQRADVQVVMVSRGDAAANRVKAAEQGLSFPIGLQQHWEISRTYAMFATPIAYFIDEQGVIASPVATGPDAILALFASVASGPSRVVRGRAGPERARVGNLTH